MSLANTTVKAVYTGDGSNRVFAIPFTPIVDDSSETLVYIRDESVTPNTITLQTEGLANDYTLTDAASDEDFHVNVTFNTGNAPASTDKVIILRSLPKTQTMDLAPSTSFSPETFERSMDRLAAQVQELELVTARCIKVPEASAAADGGITEITPVDGQYLSWDSSGNPQNSSFTSSSGVSTQAAFLSQPEMTNGLVAYKSSAGTSVGPAATYTEKPIISAVDAGTQPEFEITGHNLFLGQYVLLDSLAGGSWFFFSGFVGEVVQVIDADNVKVDIGIDTTGAGTLTSGNLILKPPFFSSNSIHGINGLRTYGSINSSLNINAVGNITATGTVTGNSFELGRENVLVDNTSSPTVLVSHTQVICTYTGGTISVGLPDVDSTHTGHRIRIKKAADTDETMTITAKFGDDIGTDGLTSMTLYAYNSWVELMYVDGGNNVWHIVDYHDPITARYVTTTGATIDNTWRRFDADLTTNGYDSHQSVTTGASWEFAAKVAGKYQFNANVATTGGTWANGQFVGIRLIRKTGTVIHAQHFNYAETSGGGSAMQCNFTATIELAKDEICYLEHRSSQASTLNGNDEDNYIEVHKVD